MKSLFKKYYDVLRFFLMKSAFIKKEKELFSTLRKRKMGKSRRRKKAEPRAARCISVSQTTRWVLTAACRFGGKS